MEADKKTERTTVTCGGCGKEIQITTGPGHTSIAKCECGATTYIKNGSAEFIGELNKILGKVPAIFQSLKDTKRRGFETGLDEALHEASKSITMEIIHEDREIREALKAQVHQVLRASLFGTEGAV